MDKPSQLTVDNSGNDRDESNKWTTISIQSQQLQSNTHSTFQQKPLTRSTCSHTILNSPSSSCRLHVVSLNSSNNQPSQCSADLSIHPLDRKQKQSEWLLQSSRSDESKMSIFPSPSIDIPSSHYNHHPFKSSISTPTNTITELSSLSSTKSPCQLNLDCQVSSEIWKDPNAHNNYSQHQQYYQSPTTLSKASSISRSSIPRSIQFFTKSKIGQRSSFSSSSIGWLKFGFKILLMFTVLFWLFSIVTWMSIMPKTMPISLTIITSMMTIGLIISLVIQSEWPYSFEFMPNIVEQGNEDDTSDDYDDDAGCASEDVDFMEDLDTTRIEPHRNSNNKISYKNIIQQNISDKKKDKKKNNVHQKSKCNREESVDSGLDYSNSIPQEITVIQIDDN